MEVTRQERVADGIGATIASIWFFAGYEYFSRYFTHFSHPFQPQRVDFSPVTNLGGHKRRKQCTEKIVFGKKSGTRERRGGAWFLVWRPFDV
jgi:hypothetical protein